MEKFKKWETSKNKKKIKEEKLSVGNYLRIPNSIWRRLKREEEDFQGHFNFVITKETHSLRKLKIFNY